jgi:hypothetical protein
MTGTIVRGAMTRGVRLVGMGSGAGSGLGLGLGGKLFFFLIMSRKRNSIDIVQCEDGSRLKDDKSKTVERARGGGSRDPWVTSGRSKLDFDDAGRCVTLFSGSEKNPDYKTLVTVTVPGYSGNVFDSDDQSRKANR